MYARVQGDPKGFGRAFMVWYLPWKYNKNIQIADGQNRFFIPKLAVPKKKSDCRKFFLLYFSVVVNFRNNYRRFIRLVFF